jgi:hypothetical protein
MSCAIATDWSGGAGETPQSMAFQYFKSVDFAAAARLLLSLNTS